MNRWGLGYSSVGALIIIMRHPPKNSIGGYRPLYYAALRLIAGGGKRPRRTASHPGVDQKGDTRYAAHGFTV